MTLGLPDEALPLVRVAIEIDPDYARARFRQAELLLELGQLEECREVIAGLQRDFADRPEPDFILGQLENRDGRPQEAIAAFERVRGRSGDFGALHYGLAQAYRQLGDPVATQRHTDLFEQYKETRAGVPDPVLAEVRRLNISETKLIERARGFAARGENQRAHALLMEALATSPESFAAHISLVGLYATRGDFARADEHLAMAAKIEPGHPQVYYNTGIARMAEQRLVEAESAFKQSLEVEPNRADAHTQLGLIDDQAGRDRQAREHYGDALAIDPWHRQSNWLLGRNRLAADDAAGAVDVLERVRSVRDPITAQILVDLARAYAALGRSEEALAVGREAIEAAEQFDDSSQRAQARALIRRLERDTAGAGQ